MSDGKVIIDTLLDDKGVKDGLQKINKAIKVGVAATAAGITALVKKSVDAYGSYEQLVGGVDTLFKESSLQVQRYADNAYKTSGLSANAYMDTVTSFSASLLQSLNGDTKKSAEYANQAIIDMSDNANKMGTSMESIQDAYQGFAKQNYTMLDNLKLGYGGTKTEMERLISDANAVKQANGEMADLSIDSFADVTEAIHIIQTEMGITGTTALEADTTIEGSLNSLKAAWENTLTAFADPDQDISESLIKLFDSLNIAASNLLPRIKESINGVFEAINIVFPELQPITKILTDYLIPAIENLFDWIINNKDTVVESLMAIGAGFLAFDVTTKIQEVIKNLQKGKTVLEALNLTLLSNPIFLIIASVTGLVVAFIYLWNNCEAFKNFWIKLWDDIRSIFLMVVDFISNAVDKIVSFFTDTIPDALETMLDIWNNLPFYIGYALGYAIVKVTEFIVELYNNIKEGVPKAINAIIVWFSSLPENIWYWLLNTIHKVNDWAENMKQKGAEAASSLFNSVIDGLKNLPWKVMDIGKNIVKGLWDGVESMISWVKSKFSSFADGIVKGVKSALGIHSPSRVFRDEVGINISEGIVVGYQQDDPIDKIKTDLENGLMNIQSNLTIGTEHLLSDQISPVNAGPVLNFYDTQTDPDAIYQKFYQQQTFGLAAVY